MTLLIYAKNVMKFSNFCKYKGSISFTKKGKKKKIIISVTNIIITITILLI